MQAYTRSVASRLTVTDLVTGLSSESYPPGILDRFEVSGFGPNPRPWTLPTAGEYFKLYRTDLHGSLKYTDEYPLGTLYRGTSYDGRIDGVIGGLNADYNDWQPYYDDNVYNNALSDFFDNLRVAESNLALSVAEARETRRMLPLGQSIADVIINARRAKRQFLMNPSRSLSSWWLSYKYGWGPCLNDIYNYVNWRVKAFDEGIPVRGRSRRFDYPALSSESGTLTSGILRKYNRGWREWRAEVKCWCGIDNPSLYGTTRITSLNPLSIAWELVPLSFVVDWFYDIGGYLQNLEAALGAGLVLKKGYVTETYYHNIETSIEYERDYTSWGERVRFNGSGRGSEVRAWKRRKRLAHFPFPRAPSFDARLGWQRITSAAALLRTILLGGVRGRRV